MELQTAEQVYAVFERLLRGLTAADPQSKPTVSALALRTGLHPLLAPFREDPLLTLSGEFVSLDARVTSLYDGIAQASYARTLFSDLPADDLWLLGEPPEVESSESGAAAVGSIGGALYLPAMGEAIVCRIRAFHASGDDPDRAGWDPPFAVRPVALAIQSSAERAFRAALLFLESHALLPAGRLPGRVYYDVSGTRLDNDLALQVSGDSLELPLLLAFLSAISGESTGANIAATGAIESPVMGQEIALRPVSHVFEKAAAFQASFPEPRALFLAAAIPGASPSPGATLVASLMEALSFVFPSWSENETLAMAEASPPGEALPELAGAPVFLSAITESEDATSLPPSEIAEWRHLAEGAVRQYGGVLLALSGNAATKAAVLSRFPTAQAALGAAQNILQTLRFHPWLPRREAERLHSILPGIGIHREATGSGNVATGGTNGPRHATRIADAANPGQVLLSAGARAAALGDEQSGTVVTVLGNYRLRDLAPPTELSRRNSHWQPVPASPSVRASHVPRGRSTATRTICLSI